MPQKKLLTCLLYNQVPRFSFPLFLHHSWEHESKDRHNVFTDFPLFLFINFHSTWVNPLSVPCASHRLILPLFSTSQSQYCVYFHRLLHPSDLNFLNISWNVNQMTCKLKSKNSQATREKALTSLKSSDLKTSSSGLILPYIPL